MASSEVPYRHRFTDGSLAIWPRGKAVCVGRNYADHATELNNPVPASPLLFIKPASAMSAFEGSLNLSRWRGQHHYETEMCLLMGKPLRCCNQGDALAAISGLAIGLDLTLRSEQDRLKAAGHPWERAKAFDGSCVLSRFASPPAGADWRDIDLRLWKNGRLVQRGNTRDMLFPIAPLLCEISRNFSLEPGDIIMTGTPGGVGPLENGDALAAELGDFVRADATVVCRDD